LFYVFGLGQFQYICGELVAVLGHLRLSLVLSPYPFFPISSLLIIIMDIQTAKTETKLPEMRIPKVQCVCGRIVQINSIAAHTRSHIHTSRMLETNRCITRAGKFVVEF
jgi:hypothetical protein